MRAVADQRGSGIAIDEYTIRGAAELPATLAAITQAKPDALIVDNELFLASKAADIAAAGLPAISGGREFAVAGLLVPTAPASSTSFAAPEAISTAS